MRSVPDPLFDTLDCADPSQAVPARNVTITALQALALLNDRFLLQLAQYFAERVAGISPEIPGQIATAFKLALSREPSDDERDKLSAYAHEHGLTAACRLLLNLNEFSFVD